MFCADAMLNVESKTFCIQTRIKLGFFLFCPKEKNIPKENLVLLPLPWKS